MRIALVIISILSFGLSRLSYCQDTTSLIPLHDLKFNPSKIDSCGDARLSSTTYTMLKGKVIEVDSSGFIICNLSYDVKDFNQNFRICNVKLAGIDFLDTKFAIDILNKLLKGKLIVVLSAQSKCIRDLNFEGLIGYDNFDINYSLLINGLAKFRYEGYTLDFWTQCKFEEAVRVFNLEKD